MKKSTAMAVMGALLFACVGAVFAKGDVNPSVIYGDDDRLDLYQVKDPRLLKLADSTVALFQGSDVTVDPASGKATLSTSHYGQDMGLCKDEPFYAQYNGAFCSGSLVGPDIMMTAGHCIRTAEACKSTKFVFGFSIKQSGNNNPKTVPSSDVYTCSKIISREEAGEGADYALVRLDRAVTGHVPLALSKTAVKNGTPLFVIGHPAGLPTKVAGGAKVRDASPEGYFVANLDTYGGNSGSAVFNASTGLIEGILVRGENDYVYRDGCRVSNRVPNDGGRGEDVTKVSAAAAHLPNGGLRRNVSTDKPGPAFTSLLETTPRELEIPQLQP